MRRPIRRAGITNTGSSTSANTVTCHDKLIITTSVERSCDDVGHDAGQRRGERRCAPMTSLLSRLTSAPVWVRVKKATGIVCTCSNTARRRSTIRPSPMRAENQRVRAR